MRQPAPTNPCPHQSFPPGKDTGRRICALGLHGSRPYVGACAYCITAGENTPEHAARVAARYEKSHPSQRRRISGCCDSALNPAI